ncbi:MAG: hypothetical protein ABIQ93_09060 [Saprospiraceae bacterium]
MKTRCCLLLILMAGKSSGQIIELQNPSFEADKPQVGTTPIGWYDCGSPLETPTDIQPGIWGVELPAAQGRTYISLVVRDNGSSEGIGQELSKPLVKDSIYLLSLSGARSLQFMSRTRRSIEEVSYCIPARLKVWGGNSPCDKKQLLAESAVIVSPSWARLELILKPLTDITHIFLEADYNRPSQFPYNGNVLIDNLSLSQIP